MEQTNAYKVIDDYTDALDNAPESVREFLWSDAYKGLIDGIAKYCKLTDPQKTAMSDVMFDIIIGESGNDNAHERLAAAGISPLDQETILSLGYEYFVDPAMQLTEQQLDEEGEENGTVPTVPSIASQLAGTSLTAIADRLKNSSTSTPVTRNYSIDKMPMREAPANLPITEEGVATPAAYVAPAPKFSAPVAAPAPVLMDDAVNIPTPSAPTPAPETPSAPITKSFDPYHESIDK
jgi:hypothetical protein